MTLLLIYIYEDICMEESTKFTCYHVHVSFFEEIILCTSISSHFIIKGLLSDLHSYFIKKDDQDVKFNFYDFTFQDRKICRQNS